MSRENASRLCKIVYFDEESVTDYIQIVAGGALEKTTELLNESKDAGRGTAGAKAKIGISGILGALMGFDLSVTGDAELETSFSSTQMAKNIVKNTILTDFIDVIEQEECENREDASSGAIKKFTGYTISAPKDSLSYVALISPYLSMLKGGSSFSAGDFDIAIDKLDNTIKAAKGYYEFVGTKGKEQVIFRFNIKSFKNNYKAPDLMKMDISIYAIKVGTSNLDKLNFNNEFEIEQSFSKKDNPVYQKERKLSGDNEDQMKELDVYDVLLAGVEIYDK